MNKKWGKALLWRGFSILIVLSMLMASGMVSPRVSAQGPLPWIVASEAGDWFWTADFIPGELNAAIFDTEAKGTELWVGTVTADESGFAFVDFPIHAVDLLPGMFIEVSDGTSTKGLVLQAISMDVFDTNAEVMAGMAPVGAEVWAFAGLQEGQQPLQAVVDPDTGAWVADFNTLEPPYDITEEMRSWSFAHIYDADGDANEAGTPPGPQDFIDGFDGALADGWYWINENPDRWNLTEAPGSLRIYTSPSGTGIENLLLRGVAPGDFAIETHLLFEPDANFQLAGLVIWQDEFNFLQFGRAFCDIPEQCAGNGIYFDYVAGGELQNGNFAIPVDVPNEAYLRLERRGEMVRALFSYEGITWFEIGTHWIAPDFLANGVGLTSAQDFFDPYEPAPADFDYFELTQGHGFLPEGFHDGDQGEVPRWACNAFGWAVDPDDREADINVEINVDGEKIEEFLPADQYRPDLEATGGCAGGSCGFSTELWDRISSYEPHQVTAYAQDLQTGEWVRLSASPMELTCRTSFDIYTIDPLSGETIQITSTPDADEYNPHFSPNGKLVVHHTVFSGGYGLYLTDLTTGISTPLPGGENGGYASFSPNGRWISFSKDGNLYLVSPAGGDPVTIREDAEMAAWAPNGKRLVYRQLSDGSLLTMAVDRGKGRDTLVAPAGFNPEWSPDGAWILYDLDGDLWKVPVTIFGVPLGDPVRLTASILDESHASWSPDGQTIVFHAGMTSDYDLWTMPAAGGEPTWLAGVPGFGDYDPGYIKNNGLIAYAGISPDNQAPRTWVAAYTYDLPDEYWSEGPHEYQFALNGELYDVPRQIDVSRNYPRYDGTVLLRPGAVRMRVGEGCDWADAFNPNQRTQFNVGWTFDGTFAEAQAFFDTSLSEVVWDARPLTAMQRHEFYSFSSLDWDGYVCSFTAGPPKMDLRVNYGHDWVESFYEAGHEVVITWERGEMQATQTIMTGLRGEWEGAEGFQTVTENWSPAAPDLQPGDWVYAVVDNGVTARVQLGDISGAVDVDTDSISGTVLAEWLGNPVQVECHDWGSGEAGPFGNIDSGLIYANGVDEYSCSWAGEWDIQPWQDIGVGYFTTESHWVANAFHAETESLSESLDNFSSSPLTAVQLSRMVNGGKIQTLYKS